MPNKKSAPPTDDEIEFVAKVMDYDKVLDWSRPERCDNAKALAKQMILGYRACVKLDVKPYPLPQAEPPKVVAPVKAEPPKAAVAKADPPRTTAKG